jgi:hypothetical protein
VGSINSKLLFLNRLQRYLSIVGFIFVDNFLMISIIVFFEFFFFTNYEENRKKKGPGMKSELSVEITVD